MHRRKNTDWGGLFTVEKQPSENSTAIGTESDHNCDLPTDCKRLPRVFSTSMREKTDFGAKVQEYTKVLGQDDRVEKNKQLPAHNQKLTSIIKAVRQRGLEKLEEDFETVNILTSPLTIKLALEYLKNSREK